MKLKDRIISLLLTVVMLVSMVPVGAIAADSVTEISTPEQLAALGGTSLSNQDVVLTADIDMEGQTMAPIRSLYRGTFDGGGHTISNLTMEASGNVGLFGELSGNSRITGITMKDCTVKQTGGSYSGAGMLVGKVTSSGSQVDCSGVIGGSVICTGSSANYLGGLVGYGSAGVTVSGCFSTANITAGSNYNCRSGGIIGSVTDSTLVENCYALGTIEAGSGNAGGVVGYGYGSYSNHAVIRNSYCSMDVNGTGTGRYPLCNAYNYTDFENCYYDSERTFNSANDEAGIIAKTGADLKASAADLGGAFQADLSVPINGGWPILKWQDPNAVYSYTLSVEPQDAQVTWDGKVQELAPDGMYTFTGLASGSSHTYRVEQSKDDYAPQEGSVTVGKSDGAKVITLSANRYDLVFQLSPAEAELTVQSGEDVLSPSHDSTYSVTNGTYTYTAELFGYETVNGSVTIDKAGETQTVTLTASPFQMVTFQYGELVTGDVQNGTLHISTGDHVMQPTESDSMSYQLPKGYIYHYTFRSANYAKVTGTIDLTGEAEEEQTITLPMAIKTAWGGEGDIQKPAGAGTEAEPYQIGTGAELAWLAQEVNNTYGSTAQAVLTKDIDLGDEPWTPIGKSTSYAFKGIFDGAGHVIQGLQIQSNTDAQGLFGYVTDGQIRDLTVKGSVKGANQVAGLVGELRGTQAVIERCVNEADAQGGNNVGGIVGKISSSKPTVRECINRGSITANNSAGGIAGYLYYSCLVDNCYNIGSVNAIVSKAGGIIGYTADSGAAVSHCYTTGTVTGKSDIAAVVGKKSSGQLDSETLFYLDTLPADIYATSKSQAQMQAPDFPAMLGEAFQKDMPKPINSGYPILCWQDTTPRYLVTLTVPADAVLSVTDSDQAVVLEESASKGTYTFNLTNGTYFYSVSGFGYLPLTGSFTVEGNAVTKSLTPQEAARQTVTFQVTPAEAQKTAQITVTLGDTVIDSTEDPSIYALPAGSYDYVVKAKGFTKVTGQVIISDKAVTLHIPMEVSLGWDGESLESVSPVDGVYEISDGAELAWFAQQVNSGAGRTWKARLTSNIDLGEYPWTPIGKGYSNLFAGSFDGGNFTIKGLKIDATANSAGLFGYVKGSDAAYAEVKNLTVEGTVNTTAGFAGGIIGQGSYLHLNNCHNHASVTSTGSSGSIGGIIGAVGDYDEGTVVNCSNHGAVSASQSDKVGGITGYNSYTTVKGCYNTGDITGRQNVGGVIGSASGPVTDIYNVGTVLGASGNVGGLIGYVSTDVKAGYNAGTVMRGSSQGNAAFGMVSSYSGTTAECYYLDTCGAADSSAVAKTEGELQGLTGTLNAASTGAWKQVSGINNNFPILSWQKDKPAGSEKIPLAKTQNVHWQADEAGNLTTLAVWSPVDNAESYTVVLWKYAMVRTDEAELEPDADPDAGTWVYQLTPVVTKSGITTTQLELGQEITASGPAAYCVSVTPIAPDGSNYASGQIPFTEAELKELKLVNLMGSGVLYTHTAQLPAPEHLRWIGTHASWDEVPGADGYLVSLYTLDSDGKTTPAASGTVVGAQISMDCASYFSVGRSYVFTVQALSVEDGKSSDPSLMSNDPSNKDHEHGVYVVETLPLPDPGEEIDRTGWVAISTAQQWMDLANLTADPVELPDGTHTNQQAVEWSKKYYLTADLDFSQLSASQGTKTKSLGNINNPFTGVFDGNGFSIRGLTLSNYDAGLFGYIGGQGLVTNVVVDSANVLFSDNAAVLAYSNKGTIRGCGVLNCNITADVGAVLGGMVSRNVGVIEDSWVEGGKLVSHTDTATGHAGFVGANEAGGVIRRCWSSMDVSTKSSYAGGFVGLGYGGTIEDCFALGNVSARDYSGGFVGRSVYSGNRYENCYAAGTVTVTGEEGHGFIAPSKPDSAFQPDVSREVVNCYYNSESPADSFATGRSVQDMRSGSFLSELKHTCWAQARDKNSCLPFLNTTRIPVGLPAQPITVEVAVATYNKDTYTFAQMGETVSVTLDSTGNTNVVDLMDAAQEQGKLTYSYDTSAEYGRFIHTINDYAVTAPDGWMFTIDDKLSDVGASLATLQDGSKLLWFEGTTENHFQGPTWEELQNQDLQWINISTAEELLNLARSQDDDVLAQNYRLTKDLDLANVDFPGIGSVTHPFTGRFNGQKHEISHLKRSGIENVGFFNVLKDAQITNLTLTDVNINGTKNTGALVGWAQVSLDTEDLSKNTACLVGNCSVSGSVSGKENIGGLMGLNAGRMDTHTYFSSYSAVDKCSAAVTVTAADTGAAAIGGLVGRNDGVITKGSAIGDVKAPHGSMVGGLVGENGQEIYDSHAEGNVLGSSGVGGFAGISTGKVKHSYSLGMVSGKDTTGSFAGSLSAVDTVIGAGQVHVLEGGTTGYVAGLAGKLNGKLSGVAYQVTAKNAYGNCVQKGDALKVIGNMVDYPSESDKALLDEMALTTNKAVSDKLMELFGVEVKAPADLQAESRKYEDVIFVPYTSPVGTQLTFLKDGEKVDDTVTVSYEVTCTYVDSTLHLVKSNDKHLTLTIPVVILLDNGASVTRKEATIVLQASDNTAPEVMDSIAATYPDSSDGWTVLDMALYQALPGKTHKTSDTARQEAIDTLIEEASSDSASASARSRIELVLRSLGIDSTKLYAKESGVAFSNAAMLTDQKLDKATHYDAPWLLLADLQGNLQLSDDRIAQLIVLLKDNMGNDGMFTSQWGASPDTAGAALSALARFYDTSANAKLVIDTILAHIPEFMNSNGSLGNANADAMMIIGLIAVGRDPHTMKAASGASLVDGLLSAVAENGDGFLYAGKPNAMATEQGFRALIALEMFGKNAVNIYDFSKNPVQPGQATGSIDPEIYHVTALIDAIPTPVTLDSAQAIHNARFAYDALDREKQGDIKNYDVLVQAEAALEAMEKDKTAAEAVDTQIESIGIVTATREQQILNARKAFESLTDEQKAFITKLDVLTDAEAQLLEVLKPVAEVKLIESTGKPYLTWNKVDGAVKYEVWAKDGEKGEFEKIFTTSGTHMTNTSAEAGETYTYQVRAITKAGTIGNFSESVSLTAAQRKLAAPVTTLTGKANSGKPYLTWNKVDGAVEYEVYRKAGKDGSYELLFTTSGTRMTNTSAKPGETYYYKVRSVAADGGKSAFSAAKHRTCDCARPVLNVETRNGHPYLTWNKVDGAVKYVVYRADGENGEFTELFTTTGTHMTHTSAKPDHTYFYKLEAICANSYGNSTTSAVVHAKVS